MKNYVLREHVTDCEFLKSEGVGSFLAHLLYHRGVRTREDAERFLNPDYSLGFHNPFHLHGVREAVERLKHSIAAGERIAVWSDYDCDGVASAVIMHDFLCKIGYGNFRIYIPDRQEEGFGLNASGIKELARDNVRLIVVLDCGIADVAEIELASSLGLDVIVVDHHVPNDVLPAALAIVNPKQRECSYPDKSLCGAGLTFKFVCAFLKVHAPTDMVSGWERWLLDMVGLATLSDMVPLSGENRVLAHFGLKVLRKSPRVGVRIMCRKLGTVQHELTEDDIGYGIAPRLNAASRLGSAYEALKLLTTTDSGEAEVLFEKLSRANDERKGIVASLVRDIRRIIRERCGDREKSVIVLGNPSWRPSLLGLAANILARELCCPVFLWGREGGRALKGSCRSDGSVDILELMQAVSSGTFLEYGGHAYSGGFVVSNEAVHTLEREIGTAYEKVRKLDTLPPIYVDERLGLEEVNWECLLEIERLSPFGVGNPKPLFLFEDIPLSALRRFGRRKEHLEFTFKRRDGSAVSAVYFFGREVPDDINTSSGSILTLLANVERSNSRSFQELRLRIVDIL